MILNSKLLLFLISLFAFAGLGLIFFQTEKVSMESWEQLRISQLESRLTEGNDLAPMETVGRIVIDDFFEKKNPEYRYKGGLYIGSLEIGEQIDRENVEKVIEKAVAPADLSSDYWVKSLRANSFYINIDQVGKESVRSYLRAMDGVAKTEIDTLYLDFRFLREMDFSHLISLFNQLAPAEKIVLGTVTDSFQSTEIKSSGKPFFRPALSVFLVNSDLSLPLRKLIEPFGDRSGYEIRGELGVLPDTVGLFSAFTFSDKTYRVETNRFSTARLWRNTQAKRTITSSALQEMYDEMNTYWYGKRDEEYISSKIEQWLKS